MTQEYKEIQLESSSQEAKLPKFICDDLHFDCKEVDGYNRTWNFIISEREPGKSTLMWKKIYNAFRSKGQPSIVLRRQAIDITDSWLQDQEALLSNFTHSEIKFTFKKSDIKQGVLDVKLCGKLFFRVYALSSPVARFKSGFVKGFRYIMMDEFIIDTMLGEKYEKQEPFKIKELYNTFKRHTDKLTVYFFGNPYSLYNPFFSEFNVDTTKLKPGVLLAPPDQDYVVQAYQMKPELREKILRENPLYKFDDSYKRYAFDGEAIRDANIRLDPEEPQNFKLSFVFKLNGKVLGVWKGMDIINDFFYWAKKVPLEQISKRRDVFAFNFNDMEDGVSLAGPKAKQVFMWLRDAIQKRRIVYADIEASYMMEEIYQLM